MKVVPILSIFSVVTFFLPGLAAVTGRVVDSQAKPVKNAMVTYCKLENRLLFAVTDDSGRFSLPQPRTPVVFQPAARPRPSFSASIAGLDLHLSVNGARTVSVELFGVDGRRTAVAYRGTLSDGSVAIPLFAGLRGKAAHAVSIVRVTVQGETFCLKVIYTGESRYAHWLPAAQPGASIGLARQCASLDSVRAGKTGYAAVKQAIDSYIKDVGDVTLFTKDIESSIDSLMGLMNLDEKIGQMTQGEFRNLTGTEVQTYLLGSVFSGGGGVPADNSLTAWLDLYDRLQKQALQTRLKIPIIYGIDAVHGHSNVIGAVIFPHNIGMGCTQDPDLVGLASRATAIEVRSTGLNWTFSPCITVPQDERWGRTFEGFGETAHEAEVFGTASMLGYQSYDLSYNLSILATEKHFVADGGTLYGTGIPVTGYPLDRGDAQISDSVLRAVHLPGYIKGIQEGVATIMPSLSMVNGVNCHGNTAMLTTLLKNELKFDGFLVSDWDGLTLLGSPPTYTYTADNITMCVNAGVDMMMIGMGGGFQTFISTLTSLVKTNKVPMARIDDAVKRILRVKFRTGVFSHPLADRSLMSTFGSAEHRDIARQCVRESMVLLKNDTAVKALPIPKNATVAVVGGHADNLGLQCGGWTITWQGKLGPLTTGGTTIRKAIESTCTGTVSFSADATDFGGADYVVAVVGETPPYAEGIGDVGYPLGPYKDLLLTQAQRDILTKCRASGKKVVCVLLTGRPMVITDELAKCDAFVCAWLPGTEGQGVADVLFGDYDFRGKLTHTWPSSMGQIPVNVGDGKTGLFPYGYGLTYNK